LFDKMFEPFLDTLKRLSVPKALIPTDTESQSRRCKIGAKNVYDNGERAWVAGSLHSSFK